MQQTNREKKIIKKLQCIIMEEQKYTEEVGS